MPTRSRLFPLVALAAGLFASPADATYTTERMSLQARFETQATFHHNGAEKIDWVQQRNELRFDFKYDLIPRGASFPGLRDAQFGLLYRARYDSVYDLKESYRKLGYRRDDFRFPEGKLPREVFLDFEFDGVLSGLSMRVGRQQVVWGEADIFRSLDVINNLRLDQSGPVGEDFSDFRNPLWLTKLLYDYGDFGPISGMGLEFVWSANGRPSTDRIIIGEAFRIGLDENNQLDGFKRPHQLPFHRVRHPWELTRVGEKKTEAADQADLGDLGLADFVYLTSNGVPRDTFNRGATVLGMRVLGSTYGGIYFTLNYIFKRSEIPGTSLTATDLFDPEIATDGSPNSRTDLLAQAAAAEATPDLNGNGIPDGREDLIDRCVNQREPLFILTSLHGRDNALTGCQTTPFWYPWTHIFGITATYNDYKYTGMVFRTEQSFSTKEPRNGVPPLAGPRAGSYPNERDFATNAQRTTQVWRSMVGFDYLTALNFNAARKWSNPWRSLFGQDQWLFSGQIFNEYFAHADNQIGLLDSITDRQHHWNPFVTFLATGFFVNNRLRPLVAVGYDVNDSFPVLWTQLTYNIGRNWAVRVGDVLYMGSKMSEQYLFLHKYADRDNLYFRLTYYFI